MSPTAAGYREMTEPWTSAAMPLLRGRRRDGAAPTTLHFVHGNGFCGGVYWPFLRELLPHYGLFCHDLEGHGESEVPARFAGTARLAARIAETIAEQRPRGEGMVGVGHSFGAALTVRAAAAQPALFRALVLLDPIIMPRRLYAATRLLALAGCNPISRTARRRRDRWASRADARAHLHGRGIYRGWRDEAFDCFVEYALREDGGGCVLSCPTWLEAAIFDHPVYPWRAIAALDCPVLLVHGTRSYPFIAPAAQRARRLNRRIEVRAQAGGHCFMQEDPPATARLVHDFLGAHGIR